MNETTDKLIRDLAEKLGTTADHLWGVLCRQAPISGITNLVVIAGLIAFIVWGFKLVKRKTTEPAPTEANKYPSADWEDEGKTIAWLVWGLATIGIIIWIAASLEIIVAALLNPEYWALKQLVP